MGSINIDFLKKDNTTQDEHIYSDLHLDLENDYKIRGNFTKDKTALVDIRVSYDIQAIQNSMTAIFSTVPGERLLLPEFGLNIKRYLFSPVSDATARMIGELMTEAVEKWEPRIIVQRLEIRPDKKDGSYGVALKFGVPSLKANAVYFGTILQGEGFTRG